ncbi:hypothetical protein KKA14_05535, partial [bacterium]|nr:hypothetical protein [bacterium]
MKKSLSYSLINLMFFLIAFAILIVPIFVDVNDYTILSNALFGKMEFSSYNDNGSMENVKFYRRNFKDEYKLIEKGKDFDIAKEIIVSIPIKYLSSLKHIEIINGKQKYLFDKNDILHWDKAKVSFFQKDNENNIVVHVPSEKIRNQYTLSFITRFKPVLSEILNIDLSLSTVMILIFLPTCVLMLGIWVLLFLFGKVKNNSLFSIKFDCQYAKPASESIYLIVLFFITGTVGY